MTSPIETYNDKLESNIVYEIYELNSAHWAYEYFQRKGWTASHVVYVRYLDDQYKHYSLRPSSLSEARAWIVNEIDERVSNDKNSISYKGHKISRMTEWQTDLYLCGIQHPGHGYISTGPKVNFGAVSIDEMKSKIDEYTSPMREIAVAQARKYFGRMLSESTVATTIDDGCHYCGAKAIAFDIFNAPVCRQCGG